MPDAGRVAARTNALTRHRSNPASALNYRNNVRRLHPDSLLVPAMQAVFATLLDKQRTEHYRFTIIFAAMALFLGYWFGDL